MNTFVLRACQIIVSVSCTYRQIEGLRTVSALVSSVPGLQDLLDRLGISATTPQQISSLLQNDAVLQALGLVSNLTLNLSPVLTQAGGTLNWSKRASTQQLFLSFLNINQCISK